MNVTNREIRPIDLDEYIEAPSSDVFEIAGTEFSVGDAIRLKRTAPKKPGESEGDLWNTYTITEVVLDDDPKRMILGDTMSNRTIYKTLDALNKRPDTFEIITDDALVDAAFEQIQQVSPEARAKANKEMQEYSNRIAAIRSAEDQEKVNAVEAAMAEVEAVSDTETTKEVSDLDAYIEQQPPEIQAFLLQQQTTAEAYGRDMREVTWQSLTKLKRNISGISVPKGGFLNKMFRRATRPEFDGSTSLSYRGDGSGLFLQNSTELITALEDARMTEEVTQVKTFIQLVTTYLNIPGRNYQYKRRVGDAVPSPNRGMVERVLEQTRRTQPIDGPAYAKKIREAQATLATNKRKPEIPKNDITVQAIDAAIAKAPLPAANSDTEELPNDAYLDAAE